MPHPTPSSSANGFTGVAQPPRPGLSRHLPNPMSPQGGAQGAQARFVGANANQAPPPHPGRPHADRAPLTVDLATHMNDEWIRQTSLDDLGYSASQLLAAAQHNHQPYGTLGYYSGAALGPSPAITGQNRERAFANASYRFLAELGGPVGANLASTGAASSPSPRRRHPPAYHRSTNSNGLFTENPSIAASSSSSAERRRSRLQARLRRGMAQPGDDDMGSEMSAELSPPYWVHTQASTRQLEDDAAMLEDEQAFFAQSMRAAHRQHARKSAGFRVSIAALESLQVADLPEGERMCPICYNDYGVEGPEGINEAPLRIPRCRHIFGDHCIKKWLTQKHTCPYCRDTVPGQPDSDHASSSGGSETSETQSRPRPSGSALSEAMLNMMGPEAQSITTLADAAQYRWMQSIQRAEQLRRASARAHPHPSDSEDQHRRTRQRLSSNDSSQQTGGPGRGGEAAATGDDGQAAPASMFGSWPAAHRAPAMETLPPPRFPGPGTPDQRVREIRLTSQPQPQLFPPMSFSRGHHPMFGFSPVPPLGDAPQGADTSGGPAYQYMAAHASASMRSTAGPGRAPSFPPRPPNVLAPNMSMPSGAATHAHGNMSSVGTTPLSASPNSSQDTEGEAASIDEPGSATRTHVQRSSRAHDENEAPERGRVW